MRKSARALRSPIRFRLDGTPAFTDRRRALIFAQGAFDMSWLTWIGKQLRWTHASAAKGWRRRRRPELTRLLVELLEDRTVPTTFTWLGADAGDWNFGANWDQGTAPTTDAAVVINNGTTPIYNTTVEINTLSVGNTS